MTYIENAKNEIQKWEAEGPGFLSKLGEAVLWPAQKAAEAIIPEGLMDKMADAVEMALSKLGSATLKTVDIDEIKKRTGSNFQNFEDELKAIDAAANHYWNYHVAYAAGEGGILGAGGIAALVADVPALFGIALRLIQQIATCYGYDINKPEEHEYILNVLRVGSTSDIKAKVEFVITLKQVEEVLIKVAWKRMSEALAKKEISSLSAMAAFKQFCKSLGIQLTKRKALQLVPVIGAVVGAAFNSTFINDVGRAAYMSYRRRKIAECEKNLGG